MQVLMATGGIAQTNCYIIADETTGDCVLVDAPNHTVRPLLEQVQKRGWTLRALWLTHGHFDHLADHQVVRDMFPGAQVLIHELDVPLLKNPMSRMFPLPFTIPPGTPDRVLHDGDIVEVGSLRATVLHTPGHCPGHVCFYFESEKVLAVGDLIICGAIGRLDLPGCSERDMARSLSRVMKLDDDVLLLPGHCDQSTIGQERARNEMVRELIDAVD